MIFSMQEKFEENNMREYKCLGSEHGYSRYIVTAEPNHVFEYMTSAIGFAREVDGEAVGLLLTSFWNLMGATEKDAHFIGYGVMKDGELL